MPHNGEINQKFGIYRTVCCGTEIVISRGATFPDCPNHRKLTTIWILIQDKATSQAANQLEFDSTLNTHIANRRLFNVAAGLLRLDAREQDHLHECEVCQSVLNVLVKQRLDGMNQYPPKASDAA